MNISGIFSMLLCSALFLGIGHASLAQKREFYEIKIYHLNSPEQEKRVDQYLEKAYLPALHRMGVKNIGVFKPVSSDSMAGKLIYVLTPAKSLDLLHTLPQRLDKDAAYLAAGADYINAPYNNTPYARFETIFLQAFKTMPVLKKSALTGPKSERIYELRSYEGHTEKIYRNKVKMFDDGGEVPLFERLGFNALFYGEVIAGSKMPNLMYITTFANKASRDEHWKTFANDAEWNKLKVDPQYQNNVSKNTQYFLYPTEYSDL
jgi:hypothetical protein